MSYVLHYAPDNASMIVRLVLEDLGLPYQVALVDRAVQAHQSTAFRALNPAGLIPALETPQGVMFETAAILLWLADTHRAMAPEPGSARRPAFLSTLFFTSNTLHAQLRMMFYPWKYVGPDDEAQARLRTKLRTASAADMALPGALTVLDRYYASLDKDGARAPWVLDYYIACILRWCRIYPARWTGWCDLGAYPALDRLTKMLETRPSVDRVARAEGLGAHPFTAPQLPTPPEGSAL
ncbi:glutathione S-transferase [uncultured Tateyamaria sp.]|uniref:glutathione S-transferase family protein n=1 Tax=uncultured Tateyamaria sp. TaxID=455651 RepID=UPI002601E831|nr:glutathione S-transferase [uncultured Tateyamaria sp.]